MITAAFARVVKRTQRICKGCKIWQKQWTAENGRWKMKAMKRSWTSFVLIGGLALLLVTLGVLQYHGLTQISEADGDKAHRRVQEETERFAADFNREIQNAYFNFQTDAEVWKTGNWRPFNERYDYWRGNTSYPELISGFYFFEAKGDAPPLRYDPEQKAFVPTETTPEIADVQARSRVETGFRPFLADIYTLVLPGHETGPEIEKIIIPRRAAPSGPLMHMPEKYGFLAIRLNEAAVKEQVLADLNTKYFGDGEFHAAVTDQAGQAIFQTLNDESRDASAPLFSMVPENFIMFKNKELLDSIGAGERREDVVLKSTLENRTFDQRIVSKDGKSQTFKIEVSGAGKPRTPTLARVADGNDAP